MVESMSSNFRNLLKKDGPIILRGVYDALGAKIAYEAGFHGLWASGLEISASHAIPDDSSFVEMSKNLDVAREIVWNGPKLPVIADCDDGYGNPIKVGNLVKAYGRSGIAGICIEDNLTGEKENSFKEGLRKLEDIGTVCGKIMAAKENSIDDLVYIARTEALIQKLGQEEALKRAHAYADAGADLILIHSKSEKPDEILEFAKSWNQRIPLVAVPTTYNTITANDLYKDGIKCVIFANHGMRARIKAEQEVSRKLMETQRGIDVDGMLVPVKEIFRLTGTEKLEQEKIKYGLR